MRLKCIFRAQNLRLLFGNSPDAKPGLKASFVGLLTRIRICAVGIVDSLLRCLWPKTAVRIENL